MKSKNDIWNLHLLRIKGCNVSINISLPLMLGTFLIIDYVDNLELTNYGIPALTFLIAIAFHDLCHLFMLRSNKLKVKSIKIFPFGSEFTISNKDKGKGSRALSYIHPAALTVIFATFLNLSVLGFLVEDSILYILTRDMSYSCLSIAFINLFPIYPLDAYYALKESLKETPGSLGKESLTKLSYLLAILLLFASLLAGFLPALIITTTLVILSNKESSGVKVNKSLSLFKVKNAVILKENITLLKAATPISESLNIALNSFQEAFPIINTNDEVIGIVTQNELIKEGALNNINYVTSVMQRDLLFIDSNKPLQKAHDLLEENKAEYLIVKSKETFIGIIAKTRLLEYIFIKSIQEQSIKNDKNIF